MNHMLWLISEVRLSSPGHFPGGVVGFLQVIIDESTFITNIIVFLVIKRTNVKNYD